MDKPRLNREQMLAANHFTGPMLVVAGPGSGKTFLLVERIYNLIEKGVSPHNILVITFSKKSALEMERRFRCRLTGKSGNVNFGTFHAVFFNILKYHGLYDGQSILKVKDKMLYIEAAGKKLGVEKATTIAWQKDMLEKISLYKNIGEKAWENDISINDENKSQIKEICNEYMKICSFSHKLDFDDMILECRKLLLSNSEILSFWQNYFKFILVDEFQDINQIQYDVLKLLAGDTKNAFVVGDDDQSIYGFRGASPGIMQKFLEDFNYCEKVVLKLNYRSCFQVVEAADLCIRNNLNRLERSRQQTLKNRKPGMVSVNTFENIEEEALFIANEIRKYNSEDVAIIYRSDHCIWEVEEKIRLNGINYNKKGPESSFYDIEVVAIIISYLRIAINYASKNDFYRVMNHPQRHITREALNGDVNICLETIRNYYLHNEYYFDELNMIKKWEEDNIMISSLPPIGAFFYILKGMNILNELRQMYRPNKDYSLTYDEVMEELKRRLSKHLTIEGFINEVDTESIHMKKDDSNKIKGAVTFVTAHASKGLEYPIVFVAGLQEGLFPHHKNLEGPGLEEERRLFYVAMTRAKERLYLCGSGSEHGKRLSRFLFEVGISPNEHT